MGGDFTCSWTAEGWLYVAAVIDLFSRRVVGWSMSAQLVTDALMMAIWRRGKPNALLHHSDQGSQYTSEQFQKLMADNGVACSMSRSGNVWDNAAMESVFSSRKTERTARKVYRTRNQARADVFDCIELFYNPQRRHSTHRLHRADVFATGSAAQGAGARLETERFADNAAPRADEPITSAGSFEIIGTRPVVGKNALEFRQRLGERQVFTGKEIHGQQ